MATPQRRFLTPGTNITEPEVDPRVMAPGPLRDMFLRAGAGEQAERADRERESAAAAMEREAVRAQREQAAAAEGARKEEGRQVETLRRLDFKARGVETMVAPGGRAVPVLDAEGKERYTRDAGPVEWDKATGKAFQMERDETGKVTQRFLDAKADLVANDKDPRDAAIYRENKHSPWERIEPEAGLRHDDPAVRNATADHLRKMTSGELQREIDGLDIEEDEARANRERPAASEVKEARAYVGDVNAPADVKQEKQAILDAEEAWSKRAARRAELRREKLALQEQDNETFAKGWLEKRGKEMAAMTPGQQAESARAVKDARVEELDARKAALEQDAATLTQEREGLEARAKKGLTDEEMAGHLAAQRVLAQREQAYQKDAAKEEAWQRWQSENEAWQALDSAVQVSPVKGREVKDARNAYVGDDGRMGYEAATLREAGEYLAHPGTGDSRVFLTSPDGKAEVTQAEKNKGAVWADGVVSGVKGVLNDARTAAQFYRDSEAPESVSGPDMSAMDQAASQKLVELRREVQMGRAPVNALVDVYRALGRDSRIAPDPEDALNAAGAARAQDVPTQTARSKALDAYIAEWQDTPLFDVDGRVSALWAKQGIQLAQERAAANKGWFEKWGIKAGKGFRSLANDAKSMRIGWNYITGDDAEAEKLIVDQMESSRKLEEDYRIRDVFSHQDQFGTSMRTWRDYNRFITGTTIDAIPSVAVSLATGGAGALVGRMAGGTRAFLGLGLRGAAAEVAASQGITTRAAVGVVRSGLAAEAAAGKAGAMTALMQQNAVKLGTQWGLRSGAFTGSYIQNAGGYVNDAINLFTPEEAAANPEKVRRAVMGALVAGVPAAALDMLDGNETAMFRGVLGEPAKSLKGRMTKAFWGHARDFGAAVGKEGVTGFGQGILGVLSKRYALEKPLDTAFTKEEVKEVFDNAIGEAVAGGVMHSAGGSLRRVKQAYRTWQAGRQVRLAEADRLAVMDGLKGSMAPVVPGAESLAAAKAQATAAYEEARKAGDSEGALRIRQGMVALENVAAAEARAHAENVAAAAGELDAAEAGGDARVPVARAVLRVANGADVVTLTDTEVRALGYERQPDGGVKPVKGVSPAVTRGAGGGWIITDEAIAEARAVSPAAAALIGDDERMARLKDAARAVARENGKSQDQGSQKNQPGDSAPIRNSPTAPDGRRGSGAAPGNVSKSGRRFAVTVTDPGGAESVVEVTAKDEKAARAQVAGMDLKGGMVGEVEEISGVAGSAAGSLVGAVANGARGEPATSETKPAGNSLPPDVQAVLDGILEVYGGVFRGGVRYQEGSANSGGMQYDPNDDALVVYAGDLMESLKLAGDTRALLLGLVSEEVIHAVMVKLDAARQVDVMGVWRMLPKSVQKMTRKAYGTTDEFQLAHEFLRMVMQGRVVFTAAGITVNGKVTEELYEPRLLERIQEIMAAVVEFLKGYRKELAKNPEAQRMVDDAIAKAEAVIKGLRGGGVSATGTVGGRAPVARQAHNLEVVGSIPSPPTNAGTPGETSSGSRGATGESGENPAPAPISQETATGPLPDLVDYAEFDATIRDTDGTPKRYLVSANSKRIKLMELDSKGARTGAYHSLILPSELSGNTFSGSKLKTLIDNGVQISYQTTEQYGTVATLVKRAPDKSVAGFVPLGQVSPNGTYEAANAARTRRLKFRVALVDLAQAGNSAGTKYQPREIGRVERQAKVAELAARWNPEMAVPGANIENGPIVVTREGGKPIVRSGHHREAAIRGLSAEKQAAQRKFLRQYMEYLGRPEEAAKVDGMANPALAAEIVDFGDYAQDEDPLLSFVRDANPDTMSRPEEAIKKAGVLRQNAGVVDRVELDDDGEFVEDGESGQAILEIIDLLGLRNQLTGDGRTTPELYEEVRRALLAYVLDADTAEGRAAGRGATLRQLLEDSGDNRTVNFTKALVRSAGVMAQIKRIKPEFVSDAIAPAVQKYVAWKNEGGKGRFREFLEQGDMFDAATPDVVTRIGLALDSANGVKALRTVLETVLEEEAYGPLDLFGLSPAPADPVVDVVTPAAEPVRAKVKKIKENTARAPEPVKKRVKAKVQEEIAAAPLPAEDKVVLNAEAEAIAPEGTAGQRKLRAAMEGLFSQRMAPLRSQPFYSQLARVVETKFPARGAAGQLAGLVSNPQNGVKAEELKWSGVIPWAQGQPQPVTKDAVLEYLRGEGAVRFEEVRKGDAAGNRAKLSAYRRRMRAGEGLQGVEQREYERLASFDDNGGDDSKYSQYQLPGGENYREVVLAMPVNAAPADTSKWTATKKEGTKLPWMAAPVEAEVWEISDENGKRIRNMPVSKFPTAEAALAESARMYDSAIEQGLRDGKYTSSHFTDVPNYVAHMRLNEREDAEGQPGLFIEELQSDRHQAGREKGYQQPFEEWLAYYETPDGKEVPVGYGRSEEQARNTVEPGWEKLVAIKTRKTGEGVEGAIPDAPYRTTWPVALFKRALRDAVAAGKSWIGWTTGETQAERFDLSKQIDSIQYQKMADGNYSASATQKNGGTGISFGTSIPEDKLADYVGKEVAQKIINDEGHDNPETFGPKRQLSGVDLKVGGEGMKGFYDSILPKEVGKYVKQWGAGVVKSHINQGGEMEATKFKNFADYVANKNKDIPIWRVDITPQMRAGVEAGQALFSQSVAGPSYRRGIPIEKQAALLDAAQTLINEGVRTPEGLAKELTALSVNARQYSEAIWRIFGSVDPELPTDVDWRGIYGRMDRPKPEKPFKPSVGEWIIDANGMMGEVIRFDGKAPVIRMEENEEEKAVLPVRRIDNPYQPALLETETEEIIAAEQKRKADAAKKKVQAAALANGAAAPLTGTDTTGQGALFADDPANDLFSGPSAETLLENGGAGAMVPNDERSSTGVESDSAGAVSGDGGGEAGVRAGSGATGETGRPVGGTGAKSGNAGESGGAGDNVSAAGGGVVRDPAVREPASAVPGRVPGDEQSGGGGQSDATGVAADGRREGDVDEGLVVAGGGGALANSNAGSGVADVKAAVPSLTEDQAGDVVFAETRLFEKGKTGVLLTNGTGTGKTFSGLGIVKRMLDRGARDILIVAPSDKVVGDWVATARQFFGVPDIVQLENTRDTGRGNRVVVTTYANFGQNNELVKRPWAAVVADEAHYLSQSAQGTETDAGRQFRGLTWHPGQGVFARLEREMADEMKEVQNLREVRDANVKIMNNSDTMDSVYDALLKENERIDAKLGVLNGKINVRRTELRTESAAMAEKDRPKAVFLSATPFAYHYSLDYAESYLFPEWKAPTSSAYNGLSDRDAFYVQNLGYRKRYNKLTRPENPAAGGMLERMLADRLMKEGAMRGRALLVPFDYSRDFVMTPSAVGQKVDEVMGIIMREKGFELLREMLGVTKYLERRFLLEAIKAKEAVPRIRRHLSLGRQVLVFHDYKKGGAENPLRLYSQDKKAVAEYERLRGMFPGLDGLVKELDDLKSPLEVFAQAFPDAGIFNGDVPAKKRRDVVAAFNREGGMRVMLAQRASAKEGISLHDTRGDAQRVFLDLGIPGRPTDAIQSEGRIYRHGVQSNAVMEYLTTGTNFERWTFAETIAQRASTAENLAMGSRARALLQAFSSGYDGADPLAPSLGQGTGGKAKDAARDAGNQFDEAVALYYTNQKKTSRNKAQEGIDYFPTPEPLGLKMVEWLGLRPGEKALEPSAGHGAIARWLPDYVRRYAVEPGYELAGRLALNAPDTTIVQSRFEDYPAANKFNGIVMNPPFGTAGKTAMEHVEKAAGHLRAGGRLVAIIPMGSSMEKRFDAWRESGSPMSPRMVAEVLLPAVAFERAGTKVVARVVVLEKPYSETADTAQMVRRDLTGVQDVREMFERLREMSVPERAQKPAAAAQNVEPEMESAEGPVADEAVAEDRPFAAADFRHTKTGQPVYVAKMTRKLSDAEYARAKAAAVKAGGYYSSFKGAGAIPGFHFKTVEARDGFVGGALRSLRSQRMTPASDAEYLAAVEAGDMATAQRMVDAAAKAAGYSVGPVYHGTKEQITAFEKTKIKSRFPYSFGFHFTDSKAEAAVYATDFERAHEAKRKGVVPAMVDGENIVAAYIRIQNPLRVETDEMAASIEADRNRYVIMDKLLDKDRNRNDVDGVIISTKTKGQWANSNVIVFDPAQIKSAEPVTRDESGRVIPLSERFNPASDSILRSRSFAYLLKQAGVDLEELGEATGRARLEKSGERTVGRPELGLGALDPVIMGMDAVREPGEESFAQWDEEARAMLKRDYEGTVQMLEKRGQMRGQDAMLNPVETRAAQMIVARESRKKMTRTQERRLQWLVYAYRHSGTEQARGLASRRDPFQTRAERHREFLMRVIYTPTAAARRKMEALETFAEREQVMIQQANEIEKVKRELARMGVTLEDIFRGEVRMTMVASPLAQQVIRAMGDGARGRAAVLLQTDHRGEGGPAKVYARIAKETGLKLNEVAALHDQMLAEATRRTEAAIMARLMAAQRAREELKSQRVTGDETAIPVDELLAMGPAARAAAVKELAARLVEQMGFLPKAKLGRMKKVKRKVKRKPLFQPDLALPGAEVKPAVADGMDSVVDGTDRTDGTDTEWEAFRDKPVGRTPFGVQPRLEGTTPAAYEGGTPGAGLTQGGRLDLGDPDADGAEWEAFRDKRVGRTPFGVQPRLEGTTPDADESITGSADAWGRELWPDAPVWGGEMLVPVGADMSSMGDVVGLARAVSLARATPLDMTTELYLSNLLSGPATQVRNITGNLISLLIGKTFFRGVETLLRGQPAEMVHLWRGLVPGWQRGLRLAKMAWSHEQDFLRDDIFQDQMEFGGMTATDGTPIAIGESPFEQLGGLLLGDFGSKAGGAIDAAFGKLGRFNPVRGRAIRVGLRALGFMDALAKGIVGQMEAGAQAYRLAKAKGLSGAALTEEIRNYLQYPSKYPQAWELALEKADEAAFQQKLKRKNDVTDRLTAVGSLAAAVEHGAASVQEWVNAYKILKLLGVLFVRTPFNIARVGVRISPVGMTLLFNELVSGTFAKEGLTKRHPKVLQHAAEQIVMAVAWIILAGAVEGDDDDDDGLLITGTRRPGNEGELQARTHPATSIRIFGEWYNYGEVEPLATALGIFADAVRGYKGGGGNVVDSVLGQIDQKTFLKGINDWISTVRRIRHSKDSGETVMKDATLGFLTNLFVPNLIRQPVAASDDTVRDYGAQQWWHKAVPTGAGAAPKINPVTGEQVEKPGNVVTRLLFPFLSNPPAVMADADKMLLEWNRKNPGDRWAPPEPERKIRIAGPDGKMSREVELSREALEYYQRRSAGLARPLLPGYREDVDVGTRDAIKKAFEKGREMAREELRRWPLERLGVAK